jgi:hypothetical protein
MLRPAGSLSRSSFHPIDETSQPIPSPGMGPGSWARRSRNSCAARSAMGRSRPAPASHPPGTSPVSSRSRGAWSLMRTRSSPPRATSSSARALARGCPRRLCLARTRLPSRPFASRPAVRPSASSAGRVELPARRVAVRAARCGRVDRGWGSPLWDPGGVAGLRSALTEYLGRVRGVAAVKELADAIHVAPTRRSARADLCLGRGFAAKRRGSTVAHADRPERQQAADRAMGHYRGTCINFPGDRQTEAHGAARPPVADGRGCV